ncbi:hypothetical protein GCM10010174_56710 [Kutzneria viridogrisea]|uniref:Integral membrane protein n=2 Tax=Kutzneria TaxID=43356 RepID=A0ABR6BKZ7_9PSEU|nr:hypothetical protein [Kutzneria albida]AHH95063.1 putative membrane protein [Kutzneria albida DSM 43870]MBA8927580.1 hypothetical protein [Kutzneria viridogrisea]
MLLTLVIAAEVGFAVFLIAGLLVRYLLKRPKLGGVLLALSPAGYVVVLGVGAVDLARGGTAELAHTIGAILLGIALVSGRHHLHSLDAWVQRKLAKQPKPPLVPAEHAARQRRGWGRRFVEWVVTIALLGGGYLLTGMDAARGAALLNGMAFWTVVLVIDFLISFSYTIWPKAARA